MTRTWWVPFLYKGREIDGVYVQARGPKDALRRAQPFYVERGYTSVAGDYSVGTPSVSL